MFKKAIVILIIGFLAITAVNAAEFIINDGFTPVNENYAINEQENMLLYTWDYDDELIRLGYLENDTGYTIVSGDNNTYNVTYHSGSNVSDAISYVTSGNIKVDYGVLEVAEVDGKKYIFMVYKEKGTAEDMQKCYDELMKFNANNNIEPIADAV
ncbi:hypothetical protein [uncultured Methanobrevibacter sp.]|uniref:hypothetical protein n=1 Tax=uncultured Methanobrevibacter sp. TaxID=253161 RepID=UPI0025D85571|nr:hypothetical protein [uncultured Methanobrevibacter sp.]